MPIAIRDERRPHCVPGRHNFADGANGRVSHLATTSLDNLIRSSTRRDLSWCCECGTSVGAVGGISGGSCGGDQLRNCRRGPSVQIVDRTGVVRLAQARGWNVWNCFPLLIERL